MARKKDNEAAIKARRKFLIGAGITLATLGTGTLLWDREEEEEKEFPKEFKEYTAKPLGDWSRPINPAEVNRVYSDIYHKIKEAKAANKTKEPLAIIVAEDHVGTLGLTAQLMILSAAHKLGIKIYAAEDEPNVTEQVTATLAPLRSRRQTAVEKLNSQINPEYDPAKTKASEAIADAYFTATSVVNKRKDQVWIPTFAMANAFLKGFKLIGMDPKKGEIESAIREPAMIEILANQKQDYVVATGAFHAANLAQALKDKGQAVLLLDMFDKEPDKSAMDPDTRKRYEDLQHQADMKIIINGRPSGLISELIAHAAMAEITFDHRHQPGFLNRAGDALYANLQLGRQATQGR